MTTPVLPSVDAIVDAVSPSRAVQGTTRPDGRADALINQIVALHDNNLVQWDREDAARRDGSDDLALAAAKRDIDRLNAARHVYIEEIDRAIFEMITPLAGAAMATESPGLAIDRLSVLAIRLASTERMAAAETADASLYAERLPRLRRQFDALRTALASLFVDLGDGVRTFCPYEGLKVYRVDASGND